MPKVLVLGASGFIGLAVSQALLRSGNHAIWGTTRRPDQVSRLQSQEITPLVGSAVDSSFLLDAIATHRIDIVVDATGAFHESATILSTVVQAARDRAATLAKGSAIGPNLGYVYTSGTWVHGSPALKGFARATDLTVPGTQLALDESAKVVAWRPALEQDVLKARDVLDVAILRPSVVYGRSSYVLGAWLGPIFVASQETASKDPVAIPVDERAQFGSVHVDDLAEAYLAAVDRIHGGLGDWPVFDVVTETVGVPELMKGVARVLGVDEKRLVWAGTGGNPFFEALGLVTNGDSARARTVLGWTPRRRDILLNVNVLVAAWKASLEQDTNGAKH